QAALQHARETEWLRQNRQARYGEVHALGQQAPVSGVARPAVSNLVRDHAFFLADRRARYGEVGKVLPQGSLGLVPSLPVSGFLTSKSTLLDTAGIEYIEELLDQLTIPGVADIEW